MLRRSKEERIENADLRNRLIEQGLATRPDRPTNWGGRVLLPGGDANKNIEITGGGPDPPGLSTPRGGSPTPKTAAGPEPPNPTPPETPNFEDSFVELTTTSKDLLKIEAN